MSNPKHESFISHRCPAMPKGYSIRIYFEGLPRRSNEFLYGWTLAKAEIDFDWDCTYLEDFNPFREHSISYCPWCGQRLRNPYEIKEEHTRQTATSVEPKQF